MKCIQCTQDWKWTTDSANLDFCPHCGAKLLELLLNKSKEMTPNEILQYLMQIFGVALLENQSALEGLLSDCFSHDKELKALLLLSVRHQLHLTIYTIISHPHRRQALNRLRGTFTQNASCGLDQTNELIYQWKKVLHWSDYKSVEDNSQLTLQDFKVALRWVWIRTKKAGRVIKSRSYDRLKRRISAALTMGLAVPCQYDAVGDFSEGLAKVAIAGRWGFIDAYGRVRVSLDYEEAGNFSNGMAMVKLNGKWGFVNKNGEVKVSCHYDLVYDFQDGFAQVRIHYEHNGPGVNRGFVNKKGAFFAPFHPKYYSKTSKLVWQYRFKRLFNSVPGRHLKNFTAPDPIMGTDFIEDWKWFSNSVNYGFIHKKGKKKIPLQFDAVWDFNNGMALVKLKGKFGFINKQGRRVIPIQYDGGGVRFSEGVAKMYLNGKWGFVNKSNHAVIPFEYNKAMDFSQGVAAVCVDDKWGFVDKTNTSLLPYMYEDCRKFHSGLAGVKMSGKWGFICIPRKQGVWSILKKIVPHPNWQVMSRHEEIQAADINKKLNELHENVRLTLKKIAKEGEECLQKIKQNNLDELEKVSKQEVKYSRSVNQDACIAFLQKYGNSELVESMRRFISRPGKTMEEKYQHWLDGGAGSASNEGFVETGIEFEALSQMDGGSLDLFQFLYDVEMGIL